MSISPPVMFSPELATAFAVFGLGTLALTRFALGSPAVRTFVIARKWLYPNSWSILRIALGLSVPVTLLSFFERGLFCSGIGGCGFGQIAAAAFLGFAMATDYVDGAIARACGLVSHAGKWLDPLADKIVYLPMLMLFSWDGRLSFAWFAILLVAEIIGTVGRPWLTASATLWGKLKTCLAFGFLAWLVCWQNVVQWSALGQAETWTGWLLAALAIASVVSKIPALRR